MRSEKLKVDTQNIDYFVNNTRYSYENLCERSQLVVHYGVTIVFFIPSLVLSRHGGAKVYEHPVW